MDKHSVIVEVIESNPNSVKVKLPFLEVPVEMNELFFRSRLESGYFKINAGV